MSSARSEMVRALRDAMLRVEGGDAAFGEINAAFHTLADAISDVTAGRVMIGRLADVQSGGDLDLMAVAGKGGTFPLFVRSTADSAFTIVVGLLVTSPLGFPVEVRVGDERHVAAGRMELETALKSFVSSAHVARAVAASQAHMASAAMPAVTMTRQ